MADFDVFISYKSEDISYARPIAEALIANGLSVWIDEYRLIDPAFWEDGNDSLLDENIAIGANSCRVAVVLLSNAWAKSKWCIKELEFLLGSPKLSALLVLKLPELEPPSQDYLERRERLSSSETLPPPNYMSYSGDLKRLLDEINELDCFGMRLAAPAPSVAATNGSAICVGRTNGLQRSIIRYNPLAYKHSLVGSALMWLRTGTPIRRLAVVNGNFTFMNVTYFPNQTLKHLSAKLSACAADDRQVRRELVTFATRWVKEGRGNKDPGGEVIGMHLVQAPGLQSDVASARHCYFGATLRIDFGSSRGTAAWVRKYCFVIPNSRGAGEIDMDFVVYLPKSTREEEHREFCTVANYIDAIVDSLHKEEVSLFGRRESYFRLSSQLVLSFALLYAYLSTPGVVLRHIIGVLLGGTVAILAQAVLHLGHFNSSDPPTRTPATVGFDWPDSGLSRFILCPVRNLVSVSLLGLQHPLVIGALGLALWKYPEKWWLWIAIGTGMGVTGLLRLSLHSPAKKLEDP